MFSNVSSNRLPEKWQIHIGCNCLAFLHCSFSNGSSHCLPPKRQNHIGCICLILFWILAVGILSVRIYSDHIAIVAIIINYHTDKYQLSRNYFIRYFENQWISGPHPPYTWNCFGRVEDATNNAQEAFNGVLNRLIKVTNPHTNGPNGKMEIVFFQLTCKGVSPESCDPDQLLGR